jgi:hypothetical protein
LNIDTAEGYMRSTIIKLFLLVGLILSACTKTKITCPPDAIGYLSPPYPPEKTGETSIPQEIQIGRQLVSMDEVIRGDLCNDSWSGTIYVTCDVSIPVWEVEEEEPGFFEDCDLKIEEGTVVYVAAHGDEPYYKGCSCHE